MIIEKQRENLKFLGKTDKIGQIREISLTEKLLNDLTNDMISFEYYKKNGEINKNGFMNTLLKNYFEIYDERTSEQIEK